MNRLAPVLLVLAAAATAIFLAARGTAQDKAQSAPAGSAFIADDMPVDAARLHAAIAPLFEDGAMAETRALVVLHNGRPIAERYAPGYGPDTRFIGWSMTKSVTGVLAGLMVADGRLALDRPVPLPAWRRPRDARGDITLRHLLHMASGLDHTEGLSSGSDVPIYAGDTSRVLFLDGADDMARYAESRPMEARPGEKFEYSSATSIIVADIVQRQLTNSAVPTVRRDAMLAYMRGRLFEPLGMTSAVPEFDRTGTFIGGSFMHASARDWAKFGEMLRRGGLAPDGSRILPSRWVRFMREPSEKDGAYGGHVWLNRSRPEGRGAPLFPGTGPASVFAAIGHLGQFVIVSPDQGIVVVRLGKTQDEELGPVREQLGRIVALFPRS